MQQYIRELLREEGHEEDSDGSNYEQEDADKQIPGAKRGRPRIPEKWSRVISVHNDAPDSIRTFDLGPELLLDQSFPAMVQPRGRPANWEPLFWPPHVKKQ